jgi:hypothetical protein
VEREEEHEVLLIARKQEVALGEPPGLHAAGSCLSEEDKVDFAEKSSALQIF